MKNASVMFCMTLEDEILWRYAIMESLEPLKIKLKWFSQTMLKNATDMYIEYRHNGFSQRQWVDFIHLQDGIAYFEKKGEPTILGEGRVLTLEYNDTIFLQPVEPEELPKYFHDVYSFNVREKNSMAHKLATLLPQDNEDLKYVFKFFIEINNKLDNILEAVGKTEKQKGTPVKALGINPKGIYFQSEIDFAENFNAYTANCIGEGDVSFRFATVLTINKIGKSKNGYFYFGSYIDIQEDVEDWIVKYLFAKEREMIKDTK